jgi:hypothetical protein
LLGWTWRLILWRKIHFIFLFISFSRVRINFNFSDFNLLCRNVKYSWLWLLVCYVHWHLSLLKLNLRRFDFFVCWLLFWMQGLSKIINARRIRLGRLLVINYFLGNIFECFMSFFKNLWAFLSKLVVTSIGDLNMASGYN